MKILTLGAGWMGSAVAYDLIRFGRGHTVAVADKDPANLRATASMLGDRPVTHEIDADDEGDLRKLFEGYDIVVSALPYSFNARLSRTAIENGTHFLDLGGNSDIVREQLALNDRACEAGVAIIPDCGLAPGLSNILAMTGYRKFDRVDSIHARVGGLPQHPRPPLGYQLTFSVEGLLNEYLEDAEAIIDGRRTVVPSMTGLEELTFREPYGKLEAFYTSGGLSVLPEYLDGKVSELSYKTIRYRGHCDKFKSLIDIGFAGSEPVMVGGGVHTSRELFAALLRKKLSGTDQDVVLFRVDIGGSVGGEKKMLRYEMIDRYDPETKMTAMMRATAYPTSAIALMLADSIIGNRGAFVPEWGVDGTLLMAELKKRGIAVETSWSMLPWG